jgi:polyvinyl alcohol dehydrogenase (cytochrome)
MNPAQWASDNDADLDLGSMGPAMVGDHVLAVGKNGVGFVIQDAGPGEECCWNSPA